MEEAEIQISDMEHKGAKNNQSEQEEKGIQKNGDSISNLWENLKMSNFCIMGMPEGEKKEQEIGHLFGKVMKENFPNLGKEVDMQVQEAQSLKHDGCKEAHSKTHRN